MIVTKTINYKLNYTNSKLMMILRRPGEGDEVYFTYIEDADAAANKNIAYL